MICVRSRNNPALSIPGGLRHEELEELPMVAVGKRRDAFFRHWSVSYVSHDWMRTTRRVVLI
jgi:hypothetical protein